MPHFVEDGHEKLPAGMQKSGDKLGRCGGLWGASLVPKCNLISSEFAPPAPCSGVAFSVMAQR